MEPVLRQHLGKVFIAAGAYGAAAEQFATAFDQRLRAESGSPIGVLLSSGQARDRGRQLATRSAVRPTAP